MPYVGNIPAEKYAAFNVQHFTTSATTSYTLTHAVANELDIRLVLNNVVQQPGASYAYTASATTLTLSVATTGTDTMYAVYIGKAVQTVTPPDGSVSESKLQVSNSPTNGYVLSAQSAASGGLTWAADAAGTITAFTNGVDNRVVTATSATALNGEAKLTFDGSTLINAQDAGAASEIKASAATVYTKIIADDASGFSAIDYSHDLRFKDAGTETMRIDSGGSLTNTNGVYKINKLTEAANDQGFNFDSTGATNISCAQNVAIAVTTNLNASGMLLINETAQTGACCSVLLGGGAVNIFAQATGSTFANTSTPSISQFGIYIDSGKIYLKNGAAATMSINMQTFRTRNAT